MRRPPDVGKAALCIVLLLGVSGCAGFSQRTTGSSPWTAGSDGQNAAPPGLFSWWHGRGTQTGSAPSNSTDVQETAGRSQGYSESSQTATSPWPETQSEWMARNFPRFNRLWNGSPAGTRATGPDSSGVAWSNRVPDQSLSDRPAVAASAPRSDGEVRPTDGSLLPAGDSGAAPAGSRAQNLNELPFSATPPPVRSPRQTTPEPGGTAGSEAPAPAALPLSSTDAAENDGARRVSFEPQDASAAQQKAGATGRGSAADQPAPGPTPLDDILPAPLLAGPQESAAPAGDTGRATGSPAVLPVANGPASGAEPPASLDTRMAQIPPAPPVVPRTPPAPSPSGDDTEAVSPPAPPASPAANAAGTENASGATSTSTPTAPAAAPAQAAAGVTWGQRPLAGSGQSFYASPPPMAPAQPRHHFFSWLFHDDDDAAVLTSAQAPTKATPTMYSSPQNVHPTGQGNAGCEADCKTPKKPCFLKVWIHDWKNSHGADCGAGDVCASAQTTAPCDSGAAAPKKPCFLKVWIHDWQNSHGSAVSDCGPAPVYASAQANVPACETSVKAPKKPCFLKVWIHDWKNGHGSGCGDCQNGGGSCCQNGKCCGGGITGSAQGGIASAQATAAH
jgi:hypothetical protein